jgi:hypothetical protein
MSQPIVSFMVRARDRAALAEVASRVGDALNLRFDLSNSYRLSEAPAMAAATLGLEVSVTYWPPLPEGELRTYQVTGYPADDVREPSDRVVDISEFVRAVLSARDTVEWYVPDLAERRRDVGLDPPAATRPDTA